MPTRDHSFRLGRIDPESIPPLADIGAEIETGIEGEMGDRRGARVVPYSEEYNLLFFKFVKEISREIVTLDEFNRDTEREVYPRRVMKFILHPDGYFFYESVQGVSATEAVNFLSGYTSEELEVKEYGDVPRKTMLEFAEEHLDRVKKFKVEDIGEFEPNPIPIPDRIREIIEEFGHVIDNNTGSVGRDEDADATQNELSAGLMVTSSPRMIRGEDTDERVEELNSSGIYRSRYDDEEMSPEEESKHIMNKIDSVFGNLSEDSEVSESSSSESDSQDTDLGDF